MKIEYLELKNFSNINTALKTNKVSIDFTKCKNKIILLTGPNGSGKTSILSCLHPFATNGNLDVRNDNPLVLIGKEGYKEIRINDDGNEYIIKHHYIPSKETHSVKSYIMRNGVELNPNGNVTSFKERVKEELDIEMDYLKLARLGSNVTNFIDLKTTERKSFMGKILDEVEIYLKYYKKITNDMREVKSIISHTVDKLGKLNINDEDDLKKYQKKLSKELKEYEDKLSDINSKISINSYEINKYDSPLVVKENLDIKKKEMNKILKVLSKKSSDITIEECKKLMDELSKDILELGTKSKMLQDMKVELLLSLDKIIEEYEDIDRELSKMENSSEIQEITNMIDKLRNKIETRSKENNLSKYEYRFTKKEIEDLIVTLDLSNDILLTTYEFGKEPIKKAISYIENRYNIDEYVENHHSRVYKNKLQAYCEYVYKEISKKLGNIKAGCNNYGGCKAMEFYNEISDYATEEPDIIIEDETFVTYTKMSHKNITTILKNIKSHKDTFNKLPEVIQNMFTTKNIFERMENMKPLYEKELLYRELSLVTEYELQEQDLKTLDELKQKLKLVKESKGNSEYIKKRKDTLEDDKEKLLSDIDDKTNEISKIQEELYSKKNTVDELAKLYNSLQDKDKIESECNELNTIFEKLRVLFTEKKELSDTLSMLEFEYNKLQKEYNDNEYRLKSYDTLNKELTSYNTTYEEMELIKNSLSSKEGIPLLYIQIYLKNIQEITNELLNIIYEDELYIEDFNITANEFKIPFVTKGTQIKDVCYASQGEKSFISLALSFALIYQSISRYNIMLLDEIDSTLDTSNREKFLQILEKQMDMIDGEQIFVISHNNMFNMYPVDIIDMQNKVNSDNKLANYIKIKK